MVFIMASRHRPGGPYETLDGPHTAAQLLHIQLRALECEFLDRTWFVIPSEAQQSTFEITEEWHNPPRRYSALNCASPMKYEKRLSGGV